jgi:virginiamycin B lyase
MTIGPDGALWFTDGNGFIGRMTMSGTVTNEYTVANGVHALGDISTGPDGNLWITFGGNQVIKMTTGGVMTFITLSSSGNAGADFLAAGPDNAMWVVGYQQIIRVPTSGTGISFYPIAGQTDLRYIIKGPDNNLWVSDTGGNSILKVTTSGAWIGYPLSNDGSVSPFDITNGSDGNLYFVSSGTFNYQIGRITTAGVVTLFPGGALPFGLTTGSDGNIWFADEGDSEIGKLILH